MPGVGFEPTLPRGKGGLSPPRLPIPPPGPRLTLQGAHQQLRFARASGDHPGRIHPPACHSATKPSVTVPSDLTTQATRATSAGQSALTASHSSVRTRSACGGTSRLARTTPSIMSATTAGHGRPFTCTATTAPADVRRILRCAPTTRGGQRNPGATKPCRRASLARRRAVWEKWTVVPEWVDGSMAPS